MLRSQNYLFSAPAPPLSIISAPAPALYCHLKLFYHTKTGRNLLFFILASSTRTIINIFCSGSRSQNNFGFTGSGSATLKKSYRQYGVKHTYKCNTLYRVIFVFAFLFSLFLPPELVNPSLFEIPELAGHPPLLRAGLLRSLAGQHLQGQVPEPSLQLSWLPRQKNCCSKLTSCCGSGRIHGRIRIAIQKNRNIM